MKETVNPFFPSPFLQIMLPLGGANITDYGAWCAGKRTHKQFLRKHHLGKFKKGRRK